MVGEIYNISWVRIMVEMLVRLEYRWQHAVIIGNLVYISEWVFYKDML